LSTNAVLSVLCFESGRVRAEGERKASRSTVTSVALRGFVGVVNVRLDRRPIAGQVCAPEACLRRLVPLGSPRDNILRKLVDAVRVTVDCGSRFSSLLR